MIIAYGSLCIFLDEKERKTFLDKYKDKPCVLVEERDHSGKATSIIADNYHGMYAVAEHLVRNHGYRRFTYLAGPHGNTDANERRQAVFDVMNAYKVSFDESRVAYGDFSSCVQQQVNQLLDENADKRAIENLLLRKRQIHDKILSHIIKREKEKFSTFQQESWFVPLISRDMLCHMDDEREFYRRSLVKLQALGAEASYFYIFEHPTAHFRNEEWHCPKRMYLTAYQSGEDIIAYEEDKRPEVVTTFAGEGKITRRKNHAQNYVATIFCLFSGEIQYGILVAEIDPAYLSLFYLISRQIGNMLRMYQMSEEQKTIQRKLEILVREIQEKNEVLNFISESDALTGCMNRRGFIEKTLQMNRDHEGEELLILFADLDHLKEKVDAGCEFLTTQMFFDNNILYNFMYKALKHGIDVPVVAGIMPITNANQVKRSIALSGSLVPRRFLAIVDRFGSDPAAMKQAGIAYATDQIIDLIANGVNHVHIYTMNKPDVAGAILENLSDIYVRD